MSFLVTVRFEAVRLLENENQVRCFCEIFLDVVGSEGLQVCCPLPRHTLGIVRELLDFDDFTDLLFNIRTVNVLIED